MAVESVVRFDLVLIMEPEPTETGRADVYDRFCGSISLLSIMDL